jgi:predicted small lipoprotein YifL
MIPGAAMRRLIALTLVVSVLAACGTKGALYLPPPESGDDAVTAKKKR